MRRDHRDVQIEFDRRDAAGVVRLIQDGSVSGHSLRRALRIMVADESVPAERVALLENVLKAAGFLGEGGLARPDAGEIREYKAQTGKSGPWIRLPVYPIGVEAGEVAKASFFASNINVESS